MIFRYFFFILFLFHINNSQAQESMMSEVSYPFLQKLITAAKTNYPRAKTFDIKLKVADLAIKKAKLDWLNIVTFTYLYSPTNTTTLVNPTYSSGYQIGLGTSIGGILQKPGMIKATKEAYKIALLDQEEYNLQIENIVKQRYFTYIQAMTMLKWRMKDVSGAELTVKDIKYRFEKGEQTFDNYNKSVDFQSSMIQAKIQAEGAVLIAKSNLEEIIGVKLEEIQ